MPADQGLNHGSVIHGIDSLLDGSAFELPASSQDTLPHEQNLCKDSDARSETDVSAEDIDEEHFDLWDVSKIEATKVDDLPATYKHFFVQVAMWYYSATEVVAS